MVFGIDRSPTMVAAARRRNRVAVAAGRSAITAGRAEALPYPDRRFDRVMASNVMYFWEDIPAVVAELHRVLRPGGRIVLYVTDARSMRGWSFARSGTHRLYEADAFEALLRDAAAGRLAVRVEAARLFGGIRGLLATLTDDRVTGRSALRPAPTL
jgi:ubiquinone/menaquinone biosynthesis C-methylase UbiE